MGFGHRVYKNYDPRAKIMQKTAHEVLDETRHRDDPLLQVAMELERIALHDDYFIEKKLYPNVDFYSGITLKAMGFPTTMFTVLFAVARTVGWIAQWKEMIEDPTQSIGRPRQLYTGATRARLHPDLAAEIAFGSKTRVQRGAIGRPFIFAGCLSRRPRNVQHDSAARAAGVREPISMMASSVAKASTWRRRSGVSPSSGASASASRSGVHSSCTSSGTTFSPSTRLARM